MLHAVTDDTPHNTCRTLWLYLKMMKTSTYFVLSIRSVWFDGLYDDKCVKKVRCYHVRHERSVGLLENDRYNVVTNVPLSLKLKRENSFILLLIFSNKLFKIQINLY